MRLRAVARAAILLLALLPSTARPETLAMSTVDLPIRSGPGGSTLKPLAFAALAGWGADDHAAAFRAFAKTCKPIANSGASLRPGLPPDPALVAICRRGLELGPLKAAAARAFFEREFQPYEITPAEGQGFLTGYYEPEMEGSLTRSERFPVPVLARPDDLASYPGGVPGLDGGLTAARKTPAGLEPYPDRAAIWGGALNGRKLELLYVRDEVELFLAQVQGSARVRLPDGKLRRLVYAGRNGHPYTSIGKVIVTEGHMTLEEMTLEKLKAWLREHPDDGRRIMRLNRSYIFFALGKGMRPDQGPTGAASVELTPGRSIAVDRSLWPYGLPFWIDADLSSATGSPFARLMTAQDTGSAILGAARADIFLGSGAEAGRQAGLVRHRGRFVVLLPKVRP